MKYPQKDEIFSRLEANVSQQGDKADILAALRVLNEVVDSVSSRVDRLDDLRGSPTTDTTQTSKNVEEEFSTTEVP